MAGKPPIWQRSMPPDERDFENALARNIFQDGRYRRTGRPGSRVTRAPHCGELDAQEQGALVRGEVAFPDPEAFADARA